MLPSWTLWPWETPTLECRGRGMLSPPCGGHLAQALDPGPACLPAALLPAAGQVSRPRQDWLSSLLPLRPTRTPPNPPLDTQRTDSQVSLHCLISRSPCKHPRFAQGARVPLSVQQATWWVGIDHTPSELN